MTIKDAPYGYTINRDLRIKYHDGYIRKDSEVTHLIVHGTAGGNTAEFNISWMLDGGYIGNGVYRSHQYKKGVALFQYIIDRDGKIIELINPHNFVYHSSTGGNSSARSGFDRHTIGIELTNPDRNNNGIYTNNQYKSLAWLCLFLKSIFENINDIYGHGKIKQEKTGRTKNCPGLGFDWYTLSEELSEYKIPNTIIKSEHVGLL